jgi:hypothetical protein
MKCAMSRASELVPATATLIIVSLAIRWNVESGYMLHEGADYVVFQDFLHDLL